MGDKSFEKYDKDLVANQITYSTFYELKKVGKGLYILWDTMLCKIVHLKVPL